MDWTTINSYRFLGADAGQWALALAAALVAYLFLTIGLRLLLDRLGAVAAHSANHVDDGIVTVLRSSNRMLFAVMALLVGMSLLDLADPWHQRVDQL